MHSWHLYRNKAHTVHPTTYRNCIVFIYSLLNFKCCCTENFLFVGCDFILTELDIDRNHVEPHMASNKRPISKQIWRRFGMHLATLAFILHWHTACGPNMAQVW